MAERPILVINLPIGRIFPYREFNCELVFSSPPSSYEYITFNQNLIVWYRLRLKYYIANIPPDGVSHLPRRLVACEKGALHRAVIGQMLRVTLFRWYESLARGKEGLKNIHKSRDNNLLWSVYIKNRLMKTRQLLKNICCIVRRVPFEFWQQKRSSFSDCLWRDGWKDERFFVATYTSHGIS